MSDEPCVRLSFWKLLEKARYGFDSLECAAFIVRKPDGTLVAVEWPSTGVSDSARWEGPFPPGTIAIAHTHRNFLSWPSKTDILAARHAGVPIYVVTRKVISKTSGETSEVVLQGDWKPEKS